VAAIETLVAMLGAESRKAGTLLNLAGCLMYQAKERIMDREHVKGAADKVKGAVKDAAGKVTGDRNLQTEGKLDKAKGAAHNVAGDAKDAVRKAGE
jgi:uncharacterized protein YjbJ (UPF0337 family)